MLAASSRSSEVQNSVRVTSIGSPICIPPMQNASGLTGSYPRRFGNPPESQAMRRLVSHRWCRQPCELVENEGGRFGPHEWLGVNIVFFQVAFDGGLQFGDRAEHTASDAL